MYDDLFENNQHRRWGAEEEKKWVRIIVYKQFS